MVRICPDVSGVAGSAIPCPWYPASVKFTRHFETVKRRPDRAHIALEWIERVVRSPERETVQSDGRVRRWARIDGAGGKMLRVVLLEDGETVHNAFFDRSFSR